MIMIWLLEGLRRLAVERLRMSISSIASIVLRILRKLLLGIWIEILWSMLPHVRRSVVLLEVYRRRVVLASERWIELLLRRIISTRNRRILPSIHICLIQNLLLLRS